MGSAPFHRRRSTCLMCESANVECVMQFKPSAVGEWYFPPERALEADERFPIDLFLCHDCGHVQLFDVLDPVQVFTDYTYTSSSSPGLNEHFGKYADAVVSKLQLPKGSLVVDVGSNDGMLLRHFVRHGMRVLGVDPAQEIARAATASGIPTLISFMNAEAAAKIVREHGPAQLCTANNAFAHTDELATLAEAIEATLAPDGTFIFEASYLLDTIEGLVFDFISHEHVSYHSVKPMVTFLRRHGMELYDIERVPTKGGSLRGFAQKLGGPRPISPNVAKLIALEEAAHLYDSATYHKYLARVNRLRDETTAILRASRARGEKVAGYGAAPTVTTLLHHFEIADLIDFIVDDNPIRHGTVSPGHHIPVFPSAKLYGEKPDLVIILAWRFAKQIINRHRAYLDQGGKFLIPLPAVEIVDLNSPR